MTKYYERIATGCCGACGKDKGDNKSLCDTCAEKSRINKRNRKRRLREQGLCVSCGKPSSGRLCGDCNRKNHYSKRKNNPIKYRLRDAAKQWMGDGKRWRELLDKFNEQQGRCAYTGLPLDITKTANLDHIVPRAKGGSDDISNLHWVHCLINKMKSSYSEDVFVYLCKRVAQTMPDVEVVIE